VWWPWAFWVMGMVCLLFGGRLYLHHPTNSVATGRQST
jgi:hypothetical protein